MGGITKDMTLLHKDSQNLPFNGNLSSKLYAYRVKDIQSKINI